MWHFRIFYLCRFRCSILSTLCFLVSGSLLLVVILAPGNHDYTGRNLLRLSASPSTQSKGRTDTGENNGINIARASISHPNIGLPLSAGGDFLSAGWQLSSQNTGDAPDGWVIYRRWNLSEAKWISNVEMKGSKQLQIEQQTSGAVASVSEKRSREKKRLPDYKKPIHGNKGVAVERVSDHVSLFDGSTALDGIYWSDLVEQSIPQGIRPKEADNWITQSKKKKVAFLEPATAERCGRQKNAFAQFVDGAKLCVRYRAPLNRFLQGEVLSYWLARYMGMDSVPAVSISAVNSSQWSSQMDKISRVLDWSPKEYVGLSMWIENIDNSYSKSSRVIMPEPIKQALLSGEPINRKFLASYMRSVANSNETNSGGSTRFNPSISVTSLGRSLLHTLVTLAQWGTMILFDYLTGNYDRVASMQDGADKERRPDILDEPIRNLRKSKSGDTKLWLVDNESGLLDAYDLMYRNSDNARRFLRFHDEMLRTICLFQRSVVMRLEELQRHTRPDKILARLAVNREALLFQIEDDSSIDIFVAKFSKRLNSVVEWIRQCQKETSREPGG